MKKTRNIFLIMLLLLCLWTMAACDSSLDKPSGLSFDVEKQTLSWNAVKGAKSYVVQISGQEQEITTKKPSISLENLAAGDYIIKIKTAGDGKALEDSAWVEYPFTRVAETGLKYQLILNDSAYELVGGGKAEGDIVMEDTFRGKPVVSVADTALYGNTKITSLVVGKNVTSIGDKAFAKCSRLTSVVIPEGVQEIGAYAFQSCKALTSIVIPDSVTQIASHTFAWCDLLTDVTLGQYVTVIGDYAFSNCESLTNITFAGNTGTCKATLPDTVQDIGTYAFADCHALPEMDLGENVVVIRSYAFANCQNLTHVELGQKLEYIANYAFAYCAALPEISVPNSTQAISDNVFRGCTVLSEVSLGSGLLSVGANAFKDTAILSNAEKMLIIDGWLIQYLDTKDEKLSITEGVYGIADRAAMDADKLSQVTLKGVKYIGAYAFYRCDDLYRVVLDDALVQLGDLAFAECPFLANVNLGKGVQTIGSYAFAGCETLEQVTIPKSVTTIGTQAFRDTAAYENTSNGVVYMGDWAVDYVSGGGMGAIVMQDGIRGIANYTFASVEAVLVKMPDSVEYIGRGAFFNCGKIFSFNLPTSLKHIGDYAFYGCMNANFGGNTYGLTIPEGTLTIGRSAFYECSNVLSLTIPGSVKTIGDYAFYNCSAVGETVELNLDSGKVDENGNAIFELTPYTGFLSLGEGIEHIGERAFQGCRALSEVTIPDSVTYLGPRAFYKCEKLQTLHVGDGITQIYNYTFYKCSALTTLTLPAGLTAIGDYAFRGCAGMTDLDLKNVQTLGRYAFYGCSGLKTVRLSAQLTAIGDYAFRGCNEVSVFYIPSSVANIGKHAFYGLNHASLYCQSETVQEGWNPHFNSSFRPLLLGCRLSDDGQYLVSIVAGEDALRNVHAVNGVSDPVRAGYRFGGWATEQGSATAAYQTSELAQVPAGTVLYAVWLSEN